LIPALAAARQRRHRRSSRHRDARRQQECPGDSAKAPPRQLPRVHCTPVGVCGSTRCHGSGQEFTYG
jgi:hypothetical protein